MTEYSYKQLFLLRDDKYIADRFIGPNYIKDFTCGLCKIDCSNKQPIFAVKLARNIFEQQYLLCEACYNNSLPNINKSDLKFFQR